MSVAWKGGRQGVSWTSLSVTRRRFFLEEWRMEQNRKIPRIMLSAASSGSGKTTMTAALLGAFRARGLCIQSLKCGPDYIDPMFHTHITGRDTYHADPFFSDERQMQQILTQTAADADLALLEGAMGYYDGIGQTEQASAYTVSQALQTPVLLLVTPRGMGCSAAALCKGFLEFRTASWKASCCLSCMMCPMTPPSSVSPLTRTPWRAARPIWNTALCANGIRTRPP